RDAACSKSLLQPAAGAASIKATPAAASLPLIKPSLPRFDSLPRRMNIGVPKETADGERRVALVPEVVRKLSSGGLEVLVERGAGAGALIPDAQFEEAGAKLVDDPWKADVVVKIGRAHV